MLNIEKILFIQFERIGDILMTTPALRAMKKSFPKSKIYYFTKPSGLRVLKGNPYIDEYIHFSSSSEFFRLSRILRVENFDIVFDFQRSPFSALLSFISQANKRVSFPVRNTRAFLYNNIITSPFGYSAESKLFMVEKFGAKRDGLDLDFFTTHEDKKFVDDLFKSLKFNTGDKIISISPVSRKEYKKWPLRNFSKIADYVIEKFKAKVIFLYGPGEQEVIDKVKQYMVNESYDFSSILTLQQTKEIMKRVNLHIGNDNGIQHIGVSAKVRSVIVYGKTDSINWGPPNTDYYESVDYDKGSEDKSFDLVKSKVKILLERVN